MNFEVVHIGPVCVYFGANRVPGAVNEIVAVAGMIDMPTHGVIHFPPRDPASGGNRILHGFHTDIARAAHNFENLALLLGRSFADETHPGNVIVHRARRVLLRPDIKQNEIALADGRRMVRARLVVRVAAIGVHRHDGRIVGHEVLAAKRFHEPLLDFMLVGSAVARAPADFLECFCRDAVN